MGFANFKYGILAAGSITSNFFIMVKKIDDNYAIVLSENYWDYEDIYATIHALIDCIALSSKLSITDEQKYYVLKLIQELLPTENQINIKF